MSGVTYVASVSGGKDSTAMCLHLREEGLPFRAAFWDTGWEHAETYRYVREQLPDIIGCDIEIRSSEPVLTERLEGYAREIEGMLGHRSALVRWTLKKGMFPSRTRRFCTQELKVHVCRSYMQERIEAGDNPVNTVGIRAAESLARSKMPERELSATLNCMVWRPLIRWTEQDVIDIHKRHGIAPNPLYLRGATRVGCWPCIQAGKSELRLLAKDEPRIKVMERLEQIVGDLAQERHDARGELLDRRPAFFQGNRSHGVQLADGTWEIPCIPIRQHIAWGLTSHGGREKEDEQITLPGMDDGCMRWGMCDQAGRDGDP